MRSYENPQFSATKPCGAVQPSILNWHKKTVPGLLIFGHPMARDGQDFLKYLQELVHEKTKETVIPPPCVKCIHLIPSRPTNMATWKNPDFFIYPSWTGAWIYIYGADGGFLPAMLVLSW